MSEFAQNYVEVHRAAILSMLDLAEEFPLIRKPIVALTENPYADDAASATPSERPAEGISDAEYNQARYGEAIGRAKLLGLGARSMIRMLGSGSDVSTSPLAEQAEIIEERARLAEKLIQGGCFNYTHFEFFDGGVDAHVSVSSAGIKSDNNQVTARSLVLSITDQYIKRGIIIEELPVSFDGESELTIVQKVEPINDEIFKKIYELSHDSDTLVGTLLDVFTDEFVGKQSSSETEQELLAMFVAKGRAEQILEILEEVREMARSARSNSAIIGANPELALPSASELEDYKLLLGRIRS